MTLNTTLGTDLYLGSYRAFGWWFNGLIDEVAIYNRALTSQEIEEHYEMGKP